MSKDKEKSKITYTSEESDPIIPEVNTVTVQDGIRAGLGNSSPVEYLKKSVKPVTIRPDVKGKVSKSKVVYSTKSMDISHGGAEAKGYQRLEDSELRQLSQVDPYISAIISTRCSQCASIARPSESKFDKGTRVYEVNKKTEDDFESDNEFFKYQETRKRQSKALMKWIQSCGEDDKDIINEAFKDSRTDKMFKYCSFADYVVAQTRNLLTFGRMATQIHRDEETGLPLFFRPLPIETIVPAINKDDVAISLNENSYKESRDDADDYNNLPEDFRPTAYIQRVDGANVNFFTEDEIKVHYFQKQALFDLRGYPLAPIEMAMYMVFIHQNTLSYMRDQFVKGLGTKGIFSIEHNDAGSELSPEDLDAIKRDVHNFLSRNDNSAVTPFISGPIKLNYIPMSSNPRDMEFLQIEEHIIRALCSAMQIDPKELGFNNLSMHGEGLSGGNKQDDIIKGEERGLRMLLDTIYDSVNEILDESFPDLEDEFRISYTGVGEDTRSSVIQRATQELQTTATLASLYADSEKNDNIPIGGDVPLSPTFHQNVVRYMKYGEFMEEFMGYEGWSKKPEYDFIIDPGLNQSYVQRLQYSEDMLQMQGEVELKTQMEQLNSMEQQTQAMEQQAQMSMQQPQGGEPQEELQQSQSLRDAYKSRLGKSLSYYFSEWTKVHNSDEPEEEDK